MIRFANEQDTPAIMRLWETCFPDDTGFNPYYFNQLFRPGQTLLLEQENTLCAMLQMLPYQLRTMGAVEDVTYIYGACTAPQMRKSGYMAQLLEYSFALDRQAGRAASILIPQEQWLFDFYKKYGYQAAFYWDDKIADMPCTGLPPTRPLTTLQTSDIDRLMRLYQMCTDNLGCVMLRTHAQWQQQLYMFRALGGGTYALIEEQAIRAYAFVWNLDDHLWAQEVFADSPEAEAELCRALCQTLGKPRIRISKTGMSAALGCAKYYDDRPTTRGYMNLMFN